MHTFYIVIEDKSDRLEILHEANLLWSPRPPIWIKVNVDDAVTSTSSLAGCGGVIRDSCGTWIVGFSQNLGICSVHEAEEWAVLKGLQFVWDMGFKNVILESDSKLIIDRLHEDETSFQQGSMVLQHIKSMLTFQWNLHCHWIAREKNKVADKLVKDGLQVPRLYDTTLPFLKVLVNEESMGFESPTV